MIKLKDGVRRENALKIPSFIVLNINAYVFFYARDMSCTF